MGRVITGIVVGFVVWSVLWLAGNTGLQSAMPDAFPREGPIDAAGGLLIVLAFSVAISLLSGYVASVIAHRKNVGPCVGLGLALLAVGTIVQTQYWDRMPLWYHLSFLALLLPVTVVGGWIQLRRWRPSKG